MAITSSDIQNQSFKIERRGYDVDEVDVFLERVASEIDELNDRIARLRVQVKEAASASRTEVISERPVAASDEEAKPAGIDPALVAEKDAMTPSSRRSCATARATILLLPRLLLLLSVPPTKLFLMPRPMQSRPVGTPKMKDVASSIRPIAKSRRLFDHINELSSSREKVREQYQDMLKEFIGSATQRLAEIGGEVTAGIDIPAELLEMTTFDAASSRWCSAGASRQKSLLLQLGSLAPPWQPILRLR